MISAADVAQHILETHGSVTTMKLQKLVYYCQAWSIVWDDDQMFLDPIEAWKNGPVVRSLWQETRGQFRVSKCSGNAQKLSVKNRETVDRVLNFYGDKDAQWLSDLTHMEAPWKSTYVEGANNTILLECIAEYYSSLSPNVET